VKWGPLAGLRSHEAALLIFALTLVGDPDEAQSLVDATYESASADLVDFDRPSAEPLKRILYQVLIDRYGEMSPFILWEEVAHKWANPEYTIKLRPVLDRLAKNDALVQASTRLPLLYRLPLMLYDVEGWTMREIAIGPDLSEQLVESRINRARMMLVDALASDAETTVTEKQHGRECLERRREFGAFLDDSLPSREKAVIERHLRRCMSCPPLYSALVATKNALGAMRDEFPGPTSGLIEKATADRQGGPAGPH
jgi:RNA polymerase sigma-70 factor (ECF subfamily)